jgi:hypothetical protein
MGQKPTCVCNNGKLNFFFEYVQQGKPLLWYYIV